MICLICWYIRRTLEGRTKVIYESAPDDLFNACFIAPRAKLIVTVSMSPWLESRKTFVGSHLPVFGAPCDLPKKTPGLATCRPHCLDQSSPGEVVCAERLGGLLRYGPRDA
jgi:hypothetical protein